VSSYEIWVAFLTILRKEVHRFMRIWPQTLLPSVVTQALYFVIFGQFIGSQLRDIGGVSYMAFIVPGLVMMAVINNSFSNVVSSFYGAKFQRHVEELLVSPTPNWTILLGYVTGGVLRGILVGGLVFGVSFFFTRPMIYKGEIVFLFILLTSIVFALGGFINAIFAEKFDDVSIFPTFILTPLIYLGGVFYSIDLLPAFWQNISRLNPILYMVNGFRYGFYGISDVNIGVSFIIVITLTIGLGVTALIMLSRGTKLKA